MRTVYTRLHNVKSMLNNLLLLFTFIFILNNLEGKGRYSDKDYARFLSIARGSLFELQTQIDIATELEYLQINSNDDSLKIINDLIGEVGRMLTAMIRKLS